MTANNRFDVIIIGGSYSGLAAAMALGRSLRKVLIIDSGMPCNIQTPHSHNFLTQDGKTPKEIASLAKQQVEMYKTIEFLNGLAINGAKTKDGFQIQVESGQFAEGKKLIFATGIKEVFPSIEGFAQCWGISVLHCPYCHGYEVRNEPTGIIANGEPGFEISKIISNWTKDLILFTNGKSALTTEQTKKLEQRGINIIDKEIKLLEHSNGYVQNIVFKDNSKYGVKAIYTRNPFVQHCPIPGILGCEFTEDGYIKTDMFQKTTVNGVFACGDNVTRLRTVANAVSMGTTAGMMLNKELIEEEF